ncbi:hypothetical protein TW65_07932 [Stemphylium lycopersici]|uniref:Auxin Efflux Carrier superfamily n=1 Tax=Stemphylium lycopersici TaxID=183478 RepID=A0A364MWN5_STELY|nr:hypothetical protein TW65_07932 [Stemphylium lycopersici]RAR05064.1 Auxin Efflux Carrier superfamily [Stemphylium lycopersici]
MGVAVSELIVPFTGAIQAAFSVLLTIAFGVAAAQCNLLSPNAAKQVSKLFRKTSTNAPFPVWSVCYTLLSVLVGRILTRLFRLPAWVAPAIAFNNTTSLPLLLIQSLKQTQILDVILVGGESGSQAMDRAESYFLVNAMVSNSLTFALGPRLLKPGDEDAPDDQDEEDETEQDGQTDNNADSGDMERGPDGIVNEETSLLPHRVIQQSNRIEKSGYLKTRDWFNSLSPWLQELIEITWQFANAPLLGAIAGAVIGLTPPLHRLFFSPSTEGGYLNAWITTAIKNVGELFASLQIIVVGVKLSKSMLRMKRGKHSGEIHKGSLALVTLLRFIIWPLISIPLIWAIASKTKILNADPILWFSMMLMPTGPPAMILVALSDVTGAAETMKMTVAKFLTLLTLLLYGTPLTVAHPPPAQKPLSWTITPTNSTQQFRGLSPVSERTVWVSGTNGTVLRTTNAGSSWTNVSPLLEPSENASDFQFRDIHAFSASSAVILSIGEANLSRIYLTHDGGRNWERTFVNQEDAAFYDCMAFESQRGRQAHGVAMSDPVNGKIRLLETWDAGKHWAIVPNNTMPPALQGEFGFAASGTCVEAAAGRWYIATGGVNPGRIFYTDSSSVRHGWKVADSAIAGGAAAGVFSVRFRDAKHGIAVGGDYEQPTASNSTASWSCDGGTSWTPAKSFPGGYRSGASWVPGRIQVAIAVGTSGSDVTFDGGMNWRVIGNGTFDAVECVGRDTCWASGSGGRVARLDLHGL